MKLTRVLWFFGASVCMLGGAFYASRSSVVLPFEVRKLQVHGLKTLQAIDWYEFTGLQKNTPLFGRWMDDTLARVKANPRVAEATIFRNATGEVVIQVAEHKAFALINLDHLFFINSDGKILDQAGMNSAETRDLPVITGPWSGEPWNGEWTQHAREGVELLHHLASAEIPEKRISEVHFSETLGWVVYEIGSDARIILGSENLDQRAQRLKRVLRELEKHKKRVKEIDLNLTDRVVVKIKDTA